MQHDRLNIADAPSFYDDLADDYDRMTRLSERIDGEMETFRRLTQRFDIRSAIDAGAGTGLHSIILSKLGFDVTAVDVSEKMIRRLESNARQFNANVRTVVSDFRDLPQALDRSFDAVFCLGNSIVHMYPDSNVLHALRGFRKMLRDGGVLILQLLNYYKILKEQRKIQNIREDDGVTYIRMYEFHGDHILFNIIKHRRSDSGIDHSVQSVRLNPLTHITLLPMLLEAGFQTVSVYGALQTGPFNPDDSENLVVTAV
jgi:glycine/sarcosine N-methyltransferase